MLWQYCPNYAFGIIFLEDLIKCNFPEVLLLTLIKGKGKANCESSSLFGCFNAPWKCIY